VETNFFGALWTTQAAIPLLRNQGGGHIVQVSSSGGVIAFPSLGLYSASKWALEGLTEALAHSLDSENERQVAMAAAALSASRAPRPDSP
jgi:NAD(P)-dependent dehydrogenase (short-subunit alcohol dehydrogenase family)